MKEGAAVRSSGALIRFDAAYRSECPVSDFLALLLCRTPTHCTRHAAWSPRSQAAFACALPAEAEALRFPW